MVAVAESSEQILADIQAASAAMGAAREGTHLASYAQARVIRNVTWLLAEGRWALAGLASAGALVDAIRLESYRLSKAEREAIEKAVTEADASVSNRRIAAMLGVSHTLVNKDIGNNFPPGEENTKENNGAENASGSNLPPGLSGEVAAGIIDRRERRDEARDAKAAPTPAPEGQYDVIVVDPPWPMEKIDRDVQPNQAGFDYPTMSEDELRAFARTTLMQAAGPTCHLFMWTTAKFLPLALELVAAFGFAYCLTLVWRKAGGFQPAGFPQFNAEFVVYGRQGAPTFVYTKAFPICFDGARRDHSRKPAEFYDLIRRVTAGKRIDMFSREPHAGFKQFGDEAGKFAK